MSSNIRLEIHWKKCLYEGVIVPTALLRNRGMGYESGERRKMNVLEMICLRSLVGVSRIIRVRNEEQCRRTGIYVKGVGEQSGSESIEMVWTRRENG